MGIGLSGMISGMDTDSIVKALVSAQRTKATKVENKITTNKWTTDAWSSLNTKIYSFYTKYASKLRMQSSYMTRKASSSNESMVKASAGSTAAVGTHTLQVKKLASSQYVTGAKLGSADTYNKNSKLAEVGAGVEEGTLLTITGKKGTDAEKVIKLEVTAETTIGDFVNACKEAGLSASFDTTQQRFFISSCQSGKEDAFSITTSKLSAGAATVFAGIDDGIDRSLLSQTQETEYQAAMTTLRKNMNVIGEVLSDTFEYETANATQREVRDAITLLQTISANQYAQETADKKVRDEDLLAIADGEATGTFELYGQTYDYASLYGEAEEAVTNGGTLPAAKEEIHAAMHEAVLKEHASEYDARMAEEKALLLADTENTEINELKELIETNLLQAATAGTETSANSLSALGLGEITGAAVSETAGNGMVVVEAENAMVVLDGATMKESSNNFTVNGITLDLISTTLNKNTGDYDSIQITVGKDTDSTYDFVKEAIKEYNTLIEEMNTLYYAKSARGYDPLTSEQKEAMTEEDIKNWEDKIKGALLRRDETLGGILSGMRTALGSTYTTKDGKELALSSYGIVTGNYTEYGKLHLYGDKDDATYGVYQDRLKTALEEDPDEVMNALTGIFGKLYSTMTEKCAKTEISSALTFYNDRQYSKLLTGYEKDLDRMEDKIADLESKYYKQFTAMETALAKLQSQTNSLASMLGTGTGNGK